MLGACGTSIVDRRLCSGEFEILIGSVLTVCPVHLLVHHVNVVLTLICRVSSSLKQFVDTRLVVVARWQVFSKCLAQLCLFLMHQLVVNYRVIMPIVCVRLAHHLLLCLGYNERIEASWRSVIQLFGEGTQDLVSVHNQE